MNVMPGSRFVTTLGLVAVALAAPRPAPAQQPPVARLEARPARLTLQAGQTVPFQVIAYDADGNVIADPPVRVAGPRAALRVRDGSVVGLQAGSYEIVATAFPSPAGS